MEAVIDAILWVVVVVEVIFVIFYTSSFLSIKKPVVLWAASSRSLYWVQKLYMPTQIFFLIHLVIAAQGLLFQGDKVDVVHSQQRLFLCSFGAVLLRLLKRIYFLLRNNADAVFQFEEMSVKEREVREMVQFQPPSLKTMKLQMGLYKWIVSPQFYGWENIPERPAGEPILFVANHANLGLEIPLLIYELYKRKNIFVRALGDHQHFNIPLWGSVLKSFGVVDGTRENCSALMQAGEAVLVYPGGAREVFKRTTDQKYSLIWKDRMGFARMAIRHRCTIVPIASVGTEDMLDVMYDIPAGWIFGGRDITLPAVKPPSPDKLQRIYFCFAPPIPTTEFEGDDENVSYCQIVRDRTKAALEQCVQTLKQLQEQDPNRLVVKRLSKKVKGLRVLNTLYASGRKSVAEAEVSSESKEDSSEDTPEGADTVVEKSEGVAAPETTAESIPIAPSTEEESLATEWTEIQHSKQTEDDKPKQD